MSKLSAAHKRDLAKGLSVPARYRELKPLLMAYMPKTPYRVLSSFETALEGEGLLHQAELKAQTGQTTVLYSSVAPDSWNPYNVARALYPSGYFCNLTALYYHALTNQVPSKIYVAVEGHREKDGRRTGSATLSDHAIFEAFIQPHRCTNHNYSFAGHEITVTERVSRDCAGVEMVKLKDRICPDGSRVTCLERAIIDAVVQPQYNGGLSSVVEMLRVGLPQANSCRLLDLYDELAFLYPYWQAIGFLCERLGVLALAAAIAKRYKLRSKFYLDHGAKTSWEYDPKWQIHYPGGLL